MTSIYHVHPKRVKDLVYARPNIYYCLYIYIYIYVHRNEWIKFRIVWTPTRYQQRYRLWERGIKGDAQGAIDGDRLAGKE